MEHLTNKDIMNGDWLIPQNRNVPDRVDIITFQREMSGEWDCITTKSDPNTHFYTGFCSPIPLSPEILEKNGWPRRKWENHLEEVFSDSDGKPTNHIIAFWPNKDCFTLLIRGEEEWTPRYNGQFEFRKRIKYVHELQHALRLCGITKEIVL